MFTFCTRLPEQWHISNVPEVPFQLLPSAQKQLLTWLLKAKISLAGRGS